MPDRDSASLIAAARTSYDAVMYAQECAAKAGNSEALETLALAREWIRFTLRRLGAPHSP